MRDDPELDNILFSPVDMILEDSLGTEAGHAGDGLGEAELEVIVEVEDGQEVGLILAVERDIAVRKPELEREAGKRDLLQILPQSVTQNARHEKLSESNNFILNVCRGKHSPCHSLSNHEIVALKAPSESS